MFTLEDLLDRLDGARERTLVALEALPDEALTQPGVVGRWAIADLLSILTAWDAESGTGLMQFTNGKPPERVLAPPGLALIHNLRRRRAGWGRKRGCARH